MITRFFSPYLIKQKNNHKWETYNWDLSTGYEAAFIIFHL